MNCKLMLGNFALILFVLMVLTGVIWFLDVFYLAKQRRAAPIARWPSSTRATPS